VFSVRGPDPSQRGAPAQLNRHMAALTVAAATAGCVDEQYDPSVECYLKVQGSKEAVCYDTETGEIPFQRMWSSLQGRLLQSLPALSLRHEGPLPAPAAFQPAASFHVAATAKPLHVSDGQLWMAQGHWQYSTASVEAGKHFLPWPPPFSTFCIVGLLSLPGFRCKRPVSISIFRPCARQLHPAGRVPFADESQAHGERLAARVPLPQYFRGNSLAVSMFLHWDQASGIIS
jgi:hypothetical protein